MAACPLNRNFKTIFLSHSGLAPFTARPEKLPHQQVAHSAHTFGSDLSNLSACVLNESLSAPFGSPCSIHGHAPPRPGRELLVLRHFMTRSLNEWRRKMAYYRLIQACTESTSCDRHRYSREWAEKTYKLLSDRSPGNRCRPQ